MRTKDLWVALSAQSFPYLHDLSPMDRDGFVLLDAYLRDCLEEWCASGGQLSALSIVLLDDCARTITKRFRLLDGEGQCYFGQFRKLARQILRGVDVEQAYWQAEQELGTDPDQADFFEDLNSELAKVPDGGREHSFMCPIGCDGECSLQEVSFFGYT